MKKLIVKTALITLGAAILLGALLIVILSFSAPKVMMDLTASMGMESVSGNYAYGEWERSGDLDCLARSFLIAAKHDDETALVRFEALYADEGFSAYCEAGAPMDEAIDEGKLPDYSYRDYLTGTAARVKYRLAKTDAEKKAAIDFAVSETDEAFPEGNPLIALAAEILQEGSGADLLAALRAGDFAHNEQYEAIVKILEEKANA